MTAFGLLHAEHSSHGWLASFLSDKLGHLGEFLDEVILHGVIDTLKLVPFLFLTYLLMEFIEHKASDKVKSTMASAGRFGPVIGGVFGAVPQCGFSAAAANLYTGRVVTLGTLIAVFLSTSDEMLPILFAGNIKIGRILLIIVYKSVIGILVGLGIDLILRFMKKGDGEINIDEMCEDDGCHCEQGIVRSALHHTVGVSFFVFLVTILVSAFIFFVGDEAFSGSLLSLPIVSHFLAALIGLIPNCASSVALTRLAIGGVISTGAMISGLLAGAGVGVLILFKMNKRHKENIAIAAILIGVGTVFGLLADLVGMSLF